MAGEIQIPTGISGVVTRLEGVSFCMDGASHMLHTVTGATRLKGRSDAITKTLDGISDGETQVMVMGYITRGPECIHVSVYNVSLVSEVNRVLSVYTHPGDDTHPWPWALLL